MHEHPIIDRYQRLGDGSALKISDFLSQRQFHDLGLYKEFYRRLDVEHQIAVGLPAPPPLVIGLALNRGRRDFSERERLLLDLIRPHLIQSYRNAETLTRMQEAMASGGFGLLMLDRSGRILFATRQTEQWLATYFAGSIRQANGLPEALDTWLQHQQLRLSSEHEVPPPSEPLVRTMDGKRLIVRFLPSEKPGAQHVLLFEEQMDLSAAALGSLGLTRREAEVLVWIARGKTDTEIADLLLVSPRTVQKHVEKIRTKLGVETRTAAAARAFQAARETTRVP